jgi:hypothetical protein
MAAIIAHSGLYRLHLHAAAASGLDVAAAPTMPKTTMKQRAGRPTTAPLYLLRLPGLLSPADLDRLARHTKEIAFSTAYEDLHVGHVDRFIWRPPRTRSKSAAAAAGSSGGTAALTGDSDDSEDVDFDPGDPDPCSCFADECPQWLFQKLKVAVREGAHRWPSALPDFSFGRVRYEHIHGMRYGVGDRKSWHLDAFPKSKRPKGPPGYEDARALSVVVCLEPCESGGEFEVVRGSAPEMLAKDQPAGRPEVVPLGAGDAVVFPSKRLMHQVSAVTHGQRKSLALFARTPITIIAQESDSDADLESDESQSNSDCELDDDE